MRGDSTAWTMARFTGQAGGPVFIDLHQVAAVTEVMATKRKEIGFEAEAVEAPLPGLPIGARVVLVSGVALYVRESAEAVFEEVHRARTAEAPKPQPIRVGDAPIGDTPQGTIGAERP